MKLEEIVSNDLSKEILSVLPYLDETVVANIPANILETLSDLAADSTKEFYIDGNKKLSEQSLSSECKDFLALICYQQVGEEDRENLLKCWTNNENLSSSD